MYTRIGLILALLGTSFIACKSVSGGRLQNGGHTLNVETETKLTTQPAAEYYQCQVNDFVLKQSLSIPASGYGQVAIKPRITTKDGIEKAKSELQADKDRAWQLLNENIYDRSYICEGVILNGPNAGEVSKGTGGFYTYYDPWTPDFAWPLVLQR